MSDHVLELKEKVEEWLDKWIEIADKVNGLRNLSCGILDEENGKCEVEVSAIVDFTHCHWDTSSGKELFIVNKALYVSDARKLAEILGEEITERERGNSEYPIEYSFMYKDYLIYSID